MKKRFKDYQKKLINNLQDPKERQAYLNAALMDKIPQVFLLALKNVIKVEKRQRKLISNAYKKRQP